MKHSRLQHHLLIHSSSVATAPTVYGIETEDAQIFADWKQRRLQQHLPFTVLKRDRFFGHRITAIFRVATAPTVYGIETHHEPPI